MFTGHAQNSSAPRQMLSAPAGLDDHFSVSLRTETFLQWKNIQTSAADTRVRTERGSYRFNDLGKCGEFWYYCTTHTSTQPIRGLISTLCSCRVCIFSAYEAIKWAFLLSYPFFLIFHQNFLQRDFLARLPVLCLEHLPGNTGRWADLLVYNLIFNIHKRKQTMLVILYISRHSRLNILFEFSL